MDITVAKDGSGDHKTVQAAIDAAPRGECKETTILVEPGTYKEKIELPATKHDVTLVGEDVQNTTLTYDDYNGKTDQMGTSESASFFINGRDFTALNITFRNTEGQTAQAVAARTDADRVAFMNCRFIGGQDTLYTYKRGARTWFKDCLLSKSDDTSSSSVYLGRPWEPYGQTVYLNTVMDDHVRPQAWDPWPEEDHDDKTETAYFAEYDNQGPATSPIGV